VANATAGDESKVWREAVRWLESVERDASQAEAEALIALNLATAGQLVEAENRARQACELECKYGPARVWQDLLEAIQQARTNLQAASAAT